VGGVGDPCCLVACGDAIWESEAESCTIFSASTVGLSVW